MNTGGLQTDFSSMKVVLHMPARKSTGFVLPGITWKRVLLEMFTERVTFEMCFYGE